MSGIYPPHDSPPIAQPSQRLRWRDRVRRGWWPVPVPPTREEMEQAILAFAAEWWNVDQAKGSPADLAILGLAERLAAARTGNEQSNG